MHCQTLYVCEPQLSKVVTVFFRFKLNLGFLFRQQRNFNDEGINSTSLECMQVQPLVLVVGDVETSSGVHVVVDNTTWKVISVSNGVDICFKSSCIAYNLPAGDKYVAASPEACEHAACPLSGMRKCTVI